MNHRPLSSRPTRKIANTSVDKDSYGESIARFVGLSPECERYEHAPVHWEKGERLGPSVMAELKKASDIGSEECEMWFAYDCRILSGWCGGSLDLGTGRKVVLAVFGSSDRGETGLVG